MRRSGASVLLPSPTPPPDDTQERKKRGRRGEEEDTSYPLIIRQLQPGDFGAFFDFFYKIWQPETRVAGRHKTLDQQLLMILFGGISSRDVKVERIPFAGVFATFDYKVQPVDLAFTPRNQLLPFQFGLNFLEV